MARYAPEIVVSPDKSKPAPYLTVAANDGKVWSVKAGAFVAPDSVADPADRRVPLAPHPDPARPNVLVAALVEDREPPAGVDYTAAVHDAATGAVVEVLVLIPSGQCSRPWDLGPFPAFARR